MVRTYLAENEEEKRPHWQLTYVSMVIIMTALLVMLCSYAKAKRGRLIEMSRSFRETVQILSDDSLFKERQALVPQVIDETVHWESEKVAEPIFKFLRGKGLQDYVHMSSTKDSVIVTFQDSILFEAGSTELHQQGSSLLNGFVPVLAELSLPVCIEGHTDDREVQSEAFGSNLELSALRAVSILKYFLGTGSIPAKRLSAAGYGPYRPFVPNSSSDERKRNRRVEIIIPLEEDEMTNREGSGRLRPPSFKIWDLSV